MSVLIDNNTEHLTVSQLNQQARLLLEGHFGSIWVEGEISNYVAHRSGHWYFSLKDENAQVRCAMFRGANQFVKFRVEEGQLVKCLASVSLYEGRGDFQLIVRSLEPVGDGALQRAFEQLKQKLYKEGLFQEQHKQALPHLAENIAILSSPTGAAIRDILTTLKRRCIGQNITLYPCEVQGKTAAHSVTSQLKLAIKAKPDVIIIARGGGSLEDLWPFNDEALARLIFDCPIPVVSGVGHEIDFTICDFVADVRAATPTAAAELVSPDPKALKKQIVRLEKALHLMMGNAVKQNSQLLSHLHNRLLATTQKFSQQKQQIDHLSLQLNHQIIRYLSQRQKALNQLSTKLKQLVPSISHQQKQVTQLVNRLQQAITYKIKLRQKQLYQSEIRLHPSLLRIEQSRPKLKRSNERLQQIMKQNLSDIRKHLEYLDKRLQQAAPQTILNKGYSIVRDKKGLIVKDAKRLKRGQDFSISLAKGSIDATVNEVSD